jgi:hypothetical protein
LQKEEKEIFWWNEQTKFGLKLYLSFHHNTTFGLIDGGGSEKKMDCPWEHSLTAHRSLAQQAHTHFPILEIFAC